MLLPLWVVSRWGGILLICRFTQTWTHHWLYAQILKQPTCPLQSSSPTSSQRTSAASLATFTIQLFWRLISTFSELSYLRSTARSNQAQLTSYFTFPDVYMHAHVSKEESVEALWENPVWGCHKRGICIQIELWHYHCVAASDVNTHQFCCPDMQSQGRIWFSLQNAGMRSLPNLQRFWPDVEWSSVYQEVLQDLVCR